MIGVMVGDIAGSIYEFDNIKTKDFQLFQKGCFATDDSIMSIAVCKALMDCGGDFSDLSEKTVYWMQQIGQSYPYCGYGGMFFHWIFSDNPQPYNSCGNGAAMRVGGVGWVAETVEQVKELSRKVTVISHDHPEGIKGAEATAMAIFMARNGKSKKEIGDYIQKHYYDLSKITVADLVENYTFEGTCQNTVPQAVVAFLEGSDFEDCVRTAISVGGDSDTLACITGGIAEAFYGVPEDIRTKAESFLSLDLLLPLHNFEKKYSKTKRDN